MAKTPITTVTHPAVTVSLTKFSGNSFGILGEATKAMMKAKVSQTDIAKFTSEAMEASESGFPALLEHCLKTFNVK
jgi:hypothetical protein